MRPPKPKKRRAWLITWESFREDYLKDLARPRVVVILKPQLRSKTIKELLPILFISESHLTFTEKVGHGLYRHQPGWLREETEGIFCGHNPCLWARLVTDMWVQTYDDNNSRQTLHWTEDARYAENPDTHRLMQVDSPHRCSEDVDFDVLWSGKSLFDENTKT